MSVIVRQTYQHLPKKQVGQSADVGAWSFLQYLSETKDIFQNTEDDTNKTAYVHPIEKRSIAKVSLEMCTESLGTENGSESGDEFSLLALEATNIPMIPLTTKAQKETNFMTTRENNFPPPLNSVNGFNYSRMVRSCKEDGRLVVQAIRVCSPPSCFVSERREGRLRLCLSENSLRSHEGDDEFEDNESEFKTREEDEDEEKEEDDAEGEEDEDEEEQEQEEGLLGNNENFEGKTGNKRFSRTPKRRCNDNENGCELNWNQQQYWVTT